MRHARPDYDRFQDPAGIIPEDEPVFLLRGQDKLAWMAVEDYADRAQQRGVDPVMVAMCYDQANKMKAWAKKLPDLP